MWDEKDNEIVDKETKRNQEIEVLVDLENKEDTSRSYQQWMYIVIICRKGAGGVGAMWFEWFYLENVHGSFSTTIKYGTRRGNRILKTVFFYRDLFYACTKINIQSLLCFQLFSLNLGKF